MARVMVFLLLCAAGTQAANILLMTSPLYSHCLEVSSVGQPLADRGHNVSILFSVTFDHNNCHVKNTEGSKRINTILVTPAAGVSSAEEMAISGDNDVTIVQRMKSLSGVAESVCGHILTDTDSLIALKNEHFDLVILDGTYMNYCSFVVPYMLKVPYVAVSTFFEDFVSGRPFLPSISPDLASQSPAKRTFFQRAGNALFWIMFHAMVRFIIPMDMVSVIAPELSRQDIIDLVSKSDLFLYNSDTILNYPVPKMPNHVLVGGITTRPAQPLVGELKRYYQQSRDGVVVVTFGGNSLHLPESKVDAVMRTLQKLKFNVVWKYGDGGQYGNVKQMKWVPQNDLLGHPNTKLFVSHCGNNGVYEALYHGVPLVCTPIFGDQFLNGARVEHWEVGVSAPLMRSTEDQIYKAIMKVLSNTNYTKNMKSASVMFHSHPTPPRERAADAIEYVLKFGGDHLRSRASDMSVFTYMGYDIICFTSVVAVCMNLVIAKAMCLLYRRCRLATAKEKTN